MSNPPPPNKDSRQNLLHTACDAVQAFIRRCCGYFLEKNMRSGDTSSCPEEEDIEEDASFVNAKGNEPCANNKPTIQVYILLGQSNMYGAGHVGVVNDSTEGTLDYAVRHKQLYPYLLENESSSSSVYWRVCPTVRNVHVSSNPAANGINVIRNEFLTIHNQTDIGPEVAIGHVLREHYQHPQRALNSEQHENDDDNPPILLLKSCIGNRSLGWDLLPPGSTQYEYKDLVYAAYHETPDRWPKDTQPVPIHGWYAGKQYDDDVQHVRYVLDHLMDDFYPGHASYEIAGFFFWQGDKDRYDTGHAIRYERNLAKFIHQIRQDLQVSSDAPFVLATLGQTKYADDDSDHDTPDNDRMIFDAMMAVTNKDKYPDLASNVATVYTHPLAQGGSSNGHYNHNAKVYMDVGHAMGRAMVHLLLKQQQNQPTANMTNTSRN